MIGDWRPMHFFSDAQSDSFISSNSYNPITICMFTSRLSILWISHSQKMLAEIKLMIDKHNNCEISSARDANKSVYNF